MIARLIWLVLLVPRLHAQENPDFVSLPVRPPAPTGGSPTLVVTSWNLKHLGRGGKLKKDGTRSRAFDATQATSPALRKNASPIYGSKAALPT